MIVRRLKPTPALQDIIESLWIQDDASPDREVESSCVIPTGTIEVLFLYGDRISHIENGGLELMPRSYLTGQRSRPVFTWTPGKIGIIIASLYPWGMSSLFPGSEHMVDGYVDLALLLGKPRVAAMEDELVSASDMHDRIRIVESFLLAQRVEGAGDPRMIAASRVLATTTIARPVEQMARELSMSRRHFNRLFRSTIGIPPKVFSRIMRFQKAIRLRRDQRLPWATIAVDCGFADQAHLSREVRQFSARTAGQLGLDREDVDSYFNGSTVSRFFNTVYL